ncbi:MAG: exosortase system-associated protein, TIGR04073 family [Candidatus Omnitrophica bacterium]|nr:exosortase system-associated protein, TIGR04073 family [Candidatus Omnitrophota bacterium]
MRARPGVLAAVVLIASLSHSSPAFAQMQTAGAATKLGRGVVNLVTGWVEIPKRIYETSQTQGALAGWTWGLLRGIGRGFVRTAAGLYEVCTFPFPAPPHYATVIEPEYVFVDEGLARTDEYHAR